MHRTTLDAFSDELTKIAFDWKGFREGAVDEGIPLGGATLGAALGAHLGSKSPLRDAAMGYAVGGGLSLSRGMLGRKKKKEKTAEKDSDTRRVLGASALGYGAGGVAHWGLSKIPSLARHLHATGGKGALLEEGLPAAGAILATGLAMGTRKKPSIKKNAPSSPSDKEGT